MEWTLATQIQAESFSLPTFFPEGMIYEKFSVDDIWYT